MPEVQNLTASAEQRAWAKQASDQAYYSALARGADSNAATEAARLEWQKTIDTANQTGMWNGAYNMPSQQYFAGQFGEWMPQGPQAGQQTMAREGQTYGQQQGYGELYGQYYAPGTGPTQGQQTLGAQNQANQLGLSQAGLTGWYQAPGSTGPGTQTLAGQQQQWGQGFSETQEANRVQQNQQQNAQGYLQLLAGLRGPADWAKYQQVLGSTPGGLRDLYAAAAGEYVPGGGATTGMAPQPVSLQSLVGDVSGQGYGGSGAPLTMPGQQPQYAQSQYGQITAQPAGMHGTQAPQQTQQQYTQGVQQQQPGQYAQGYTQPPSMAATTGPAGQYDQKMLAAQQQYGQQAQAYINQNAQAPLQSGQMMDQRYRPQAGAGQTWGSGIGVGAQQPTPAQQQQGLGNGTNLPAPNQIAAQSWNNMAPSQQQMLLGAYESQGWDKNDVQGLMNQALPKYASNAPTAGTWRMK